MALPALTPEQQLDRVGQTQENIDARQQITNLRDRLAHAVGPAATRYDSILVLLGEQEKAVRGIVDKNDAEFLFVDHFRDTRFQNAPFEAFVAGPRPVGRVPENGFVPQPEQAAFQNYLAGMSPELRTKVQDILLKFATQTTVEDEQRFAWLPQAEKEREINALLTPGTTIDSYKAAIYNEVVGLYPPDEQNRIKNDLNTLPPLQRGRSIAFLRSLSPTQRAMIFSLPVALRNVELARLGVDFTNIGAGRNQSQIERSGVVEAAGHMVDRGEARLFDNLAFPAAQRAAEITRLRDMNTQNPAERGRIQALLRQLPNPEIARLIALTPAERTTELTRLAGLDAGHRAVEIDILTHRTANTIGARGEEFVRRFGGDLTRQREVLDWYAGGGATGLTAPERGWFEQLNETERARVFHLPTEAQRTVEIRRLVAAGNLQLERGVDFNINHAATFGTLDPRIQLWLNGIDNTRATRYLAEQEGQRLAGLTPEAMGQLQAILMGLNPNEWSYFTSLFPPETRLAELLNYNALTPQQRLELNNNLHDLIAIPGANMNIVRWYANLPTDQRANEINRLETDAAYLNGIQDLNPAEMRIIQGMAEPTRTQEIVRLLALRAAVPNARLHERDRAIINEIPEELRGEFETQLNSTSNFNNLNLNEKLAVLGAYGTVATPAWARLQGQFPDMNLDAYRLFLQGQLQDQIARNGAPGGIAQIQALLTQEGVSGFISAIDQEALQLQLDAINIIRDQRVGVLENIGGLLGMNQAEIDGLATNLDRLRIVAPVLIIALIMIASGGAGYAILGGGFGGTLGMLLAGGVGLGAGYLSQADLIHRIGAGNMGARIARIQRRSAQERLNTNFDTVQNIIGEYAQRIGAGQNLETIRQNDRQFYTELESVGLIKDGVVSVANVIKSMGDQAAIYGQSVTTLAGKLQQRTDEIRSKATPAEILKGSMGPGFNVSGITVT